MGWITDLAVAARKSGLKVVELDGWKSNTSAGSLAVKGVLCHHTGSYDGIGDRDSDLAYAKWLAFTGRSDLPPPLCHLSLSAEGVVYVCASGNANHAGTAKASGPMPAGDGNVLYIGIEAMNNGSQGWGAKGKDAAGQVVTQRQAYARLCAALCRHYGWPASHVRAHKETSTTGKWDPGSLDMDVFRKEVGKLIHDSPQATTDWFDMATKEDLREMLAPLHDKLDKLTAELAEYRKHEFDRDKRTTELLRAIRGQSA